MRRKIVYKNDYYEIDLTKSPYAIYDITGIDGLKNSITTMSSYGQDGSIVVASNLEERDITIQGTIKGKTKEDIQYLRTNMLKIFNPKLGEGYIYYTNGGISRKIAVNIEEAPRFSKKDVWRINHFTISFLAADPYWKDTEEHTVDVAQWYGMFEFPLEIPEGEGIEMGIRSESLTANINNIGDVPSGMIIEFYAKNTVKNPSVINIDTREEIKINKTMRGGETFIINTNFGKKSIKSIYGNVEENILNYIDDEKCDFIQLARGDNLFGYAADDGLDNLSIKIKYNNRYVGV